MRRLAVFLSLLCLLSLPVSAAYIPESSVTENRDGRQLIIKTYQLSPEDDPSELVDEPFDLEGYHYEHLETVKEDQTFHDSKAHTETVTVTTSSDSLAAILEQLAPTMEYSKDGYSGVLTLDHTTLQTEAAGYTTKYYTITDTKQFTGLPRNDPSYVPTTTVKDGKTLSLSNISWAVTGTGLADDTLVPTSYTATATYQATGSRSAATGYITTATYTGEITSEGIGSVQYTVTYLGTQLKSGFSIGLPLLVLLAAGLAMLAAILAFLYLRRPNAAIYAMNAKGVAYKKLGRQRIVYLFEDQKFFLSVLRQTDFIRPDQALPLLRLFDPRKTQGQTEALIRQLRYAGELAFSGQLLCSPEMLKKQPDPEMLEALDILLALSGRRLLEVSRNPPCKLSFLLQRGEDWIDSYAVMIVRQGYEREASLLLNQLAPETTLLLRLDDLGQHGALTVRQSCYFVVRQAGKLRFYKGGEARH